MVPGEVLSTSLKKKQKVATIDGATIVQTDIQGSNAVIHVIDTVILPAADKGMDKGM